ncbi:ATP-binding cassette domain-containing protein [Spiroplasma clarkii]|uniref:ATP-binding cassette domain-containing protein n=1 Tax=Spiroplasma clarkii TaxID=2139 RepID=UPI00215002BB|nr:ATP-binding cassette domain-containing protein [Spiroplasma clarkii]
MNLKLEKGKKYAFVGETGSGKSTIAKLILRFYDKSEGEILINGEKIESFNLKSYLSRVGYVEQEPQIIYGNVYDNVKYGSFEASDDQVKTACIQSKVHEVVKSWENGYETLLGERGTLISGGQKQRLVLARLLLKNPEILILDEATSALDNIVEKEIQLQLEKMMENKTTVIIAHRLSTIKNVDKIYVMAPGKGIVQEGNWDELIKLTGPFKKLYDSSL